MSEQRIKLRRISIVTFIIFASLGLILVYFYFDSDTQVSSHPEKGTEKTVLATLAAPSTPNPFSWNSTPTKAIINGRAFNLEVANNSIARSQGLSNRQFMAENMGMLFVFQSSELHKFWMKDVHFELDLLYISADHLIIDIQTMSPELNIADAKLTVYTPPIKILLALELQGGAAKKLNLKVGMPVQFE